MAEDFYLLSVSEVSKRLGISPRTVYNSLSRGDFPIKRKKGWGRRVQFSSADVNQYIKDLPYIDENALDTKSNVQEIRD
jgi:excisionase family DNA binding protein